MFPHKWWVTENVVVFSAAVCFIVFFVLSTGFFVFVPFFVFVMMLLLGFSLALYDDHDHCALWSEMVSASFVNGGCAEKCDGCLCQKKKTDLFEHLQVGARRLLAPTVREGSGPRKYDDVNITTEPRQSKADERKAVRSTRHPFVLGVTRNELFLFFYFCFHCFYCHHFPRSFPITPLSRRPSLLPRVRNARTESTGKAKLPQPGTLQTGAKSKVTYVGRFCASQSEHVCGKLLQTAIRFRASTRR